MPAAAARAHQVVERVDEAVADVARNDGGYSARATRRNAGPLLGASAIRRTSPLARSLPSRTGQQPLRARRRHEARQPLAPPSDAIAPAVRASAGSSGAARRRTRRRACAPIRRPIRRSACGAARDRACPASSSQLAVRQPGGLLHDAVAMALLGGERQQDLEFDGAQRHEGRRLYARRIHVKCAIET